MTQAQFQIGKNGLTPGTSESIDNAFKNHDLVRISVLPSATRNREEIKSLAEQLQKSLKTPTRIKIIGFTLVLKKSKKK
jgi:RNA-binding protein YhbY